MRKLFFAACLVAFLFYPYCDARKNVGKGSDSDDALEIACSHLLAGKKDLYSEKTYLGNPISPLPGAILFALPFKILGCVALQNLFWAGVFLYFFSPSWVGLLIISPGLFLNLINGSDHFANSVYCAIFMYMILHGQWSGFAHAGLGIALSSRVNFMLLVPILFILDQKKRLWLFTVVTFLLVTVPFALFAENFSPIHTANKLKDQGWWGGLSLFLIFLLVILGMTYPTSPRQFFTLCGIILLIPIITGIIAGGGSQYISYFNFPATFFAIALNNEVYNRSDK